MRRFAALALLSTRALAQTYSQCNPLNTQCPANTALGKSINVDFRKGAVNSFGASGSPSYGSDGVSFTVAKGGDAPQLNSIFYIMYGRVDVTLKAAPGPGIVSSVVLESDDLDEIDLEWLGANPDEVQSNYFGKGRTTTYNRGRFHRLDGTQTRLVTYTIDWTQDRIVWMSTADSKPLRTLHRPDATDAGVDEYPQTPMRVKFGAWAGGDAAHNAPGTVEWARGPTDYQRGPFSMLVESIRITDYSTGSEYRYADNSGSADSIQAVGGAVNANYNSRNALSVTAAPAPSLPTPTGLAAALAYVPRGGIGHDDNNPSPTRTQTGWPWVAGATPTGGSIPSGWYMTSEGKIMRSSASDAACHLACSSFLFALSFAAGLVLVLCSR
ncbi:hypothetical protein CDD81_6341 [Ophiocordyceps australis]|uniref:GH16 domain-containing protein n=1 Tax=Ophiocordyceps australis TaxID=1399860 RepID=A0A2C5Y6F0_9HYPO|nr:hypothetical protein CDD81_6341 [Ophiocordyceps australis]